MYDRLSIVSFSKRWLWRTRSNACADLLFSSGNYSWVNEQRAKIVKWRGIKPHWKLEIGELSMWCLDTSEWMCCSRSLLTTGKGGDTIIFFLKTGVKTYKNSRNIGVILAHFHSGSCNDKLMSLVRLGAIDRWILQSPGSIMFPGLVPLYKAWK